MFKKYTIYPKKILLGVLFFAGLSSLVAQKTIKGKITEYGTKMPIEFANVGIVGTLFGAASDSDGKFTLTIPDKINGIVKVSAIGYVPIEIAISENGNNLKNIELKKTSYSIQEVSIDAASMLLYSRLKKAIENISNNYTSTPYNMLMEYIETTQTPNRKLSRFGELLVYDKVGYINQNLADSYRDVSYKFINYVSDFKIPPTRNGITDVDFLLDMDLVRLKNLILNKDAIYLFNLSSSNDTILNGEKVWIINFTSKTPSLATVGDPQALAFKGSIYIGQSSMSIYKIIYHCTSSYWNLNGKSLYYLGTGDYKAKDISYIFETNYVPNNSKMHLGSIVLRSSYINSGGEKCNEVSKLMVKNVTFSNLKVIVGRDYFK